MVKNKCAIDIDMQIGWMESELEKSRKAIISYSEKFPQMVEQFEEIEAYLEAILESLQVNREAIELDKQVKKLSK